MAHTTPSLPEELKAINEAATSKIGRKLKRVNKAYHITRIKNVQV